MVGSPSHLISFNVICGLLGTMASVSLVVLNNMKHFHEKKKLYIYIYIRVVQTYKSRNVILSYPGFCIYE